VGLFSFLESIKLLSSSISGLNNLFNNKNHGFFLSVFLAIGIVSCFLFVVYFFTAKHSNQHYEDILRDNQIYQKMSQTLLFCGNKNAVMIGAINLHQKIGIIKDFYACDIITKNSNCLVNVKEKKREYRESYVVDDITYSYLQEVGLANQVQTIDLASGNIISPINHKRLQITDLATLSKLLGVSSWYKEGDLKSLKLGVIIDNFNSVIFTISFTSNNYCPAADNLITTIKEIINESRNKSAIHVF
jgi:hypothetical protein